MPYEPKSNSQKIDKNKSRKIYGKCIIIFLPELKQNSND